MIYLLFITKKIVFCESYEFTNQAGETVTLNYRYQYSPKEESTAVKQGLNPVTQHPFMPMIMANQMVAAAA